MQTHTHARIHAHTHTQTHRYNMLKDNGAAPLPYMHLGW